MPLDGEDGVSADHVMRYLNSQDGKKNFTCANVTSMEADRWLNIRLFEVVSFLINYLWIWSVMKPEPWQIINFDEIGIGGRNGAKKGDRKGVKPADDESPVKRLKMRQNKSITLCPFISAGGALLDTLVIIRNGINIVNQKKFEMAHDCTVVDGGESCTVTRKILREFVPNLIQNYRDNLGEHDKPIYMLADCHSSRYDVEFIKKMRELNVNILLFPAHATHIFQPVDVGIARAVKSGKPKPQRARNSDSSLVTRPFVKEIEILKFRLAKLRTATTVPKIQNSFRQAGLVPFDPAAANKRNLTPPAVNALFDELDEIGGAGVRLVRTRALLHGRGSPLTPEMRPSRLRASLAGAWMTDDGGMAVVEQLEGRRNNSRNSRISSAELATLQEHTRRVDTATGEFLDALVAGQAASPAHAASNRRTTGTNQVGQNSNFSRRNANPSQTSSSAGRMCLTCNKPMINHPRSPSNPHKLHH